MKDFVDTLVAVAMVGVAIAAVVCYAKALTLKECLHDTKMGTTANCRRTGLYGPSPVVSAV